MAIRRNEQDRVKVVTDLLNTPILSKSTIVR